MVTSVIDYMYPRYRYEEKVKEGGTLRVEYSTFVRILRNKTYYIVNVSYEAELSDDNLRFPYIVETFKNQVRDIFFREVYMKMHMWDEPRYGANKEDPVQMSELERLRNPDKYLLEQIQKRIDRQPGR